MRRLLAGDAYSGCGRGAGRRRHGRRDVADPAAPSTRSTKRSRQSRLRHRFRTVVRRTRSTSSPTALAVPRSRRRPPVRATTAAGRSWPPRASQVSSRTRRPSSRRQARSSTRARGSCARLSRRRRSSASGRAPGTPGAGVLRRHADAYPHRREAPRWRWSVDHLLRTQPCLGRRGQDRRPDRTGVDGLRRSSGGRRGTRT